jgi:hypothetical protein
MGHLAYGVSLPARLAYPSEGRVGAAPLAGPLSLSPLWGSGASLAFLYPAPTSGLRAARPVSVGFRGLTKWSVSPTWESPSERPWWHRRFGG